MHSHRSEDGHQAKLRREQCGLCSHLGDEGGTSVPLTVLTNCLAGPNQAALGLATPAAELPATGAQDAGALPTAQPQPPVGGELWTKASRTQVTDGSGKKRRPVVLKASAPRQIICTLSDERQEDLYFLKPEGFSRAELLHKCSKITCVTCKMHIELKGGAEKLLDHMGSEYHLKSYKIKQEAALFDAQNRLLSDSAGQEPVLVDLAVDPTGDSVHVQATAAGQITCKLNTNHEVDLFHWEPDGCSLERLLNEVFGLKCLACREMTLDPLTNRHGWAR